MRIEKMYLFVLEVTAGKGNEYKEGERHAALVFVNEAEEEKAKAILFSSMESCFWNNIIIKRMKIIDSTAMENKDSILVGAYNDALENGCGVVIYTDAENDFLG